MFAEDMVDTIYVLAARAHLWSVRQIESARVVLERFAAHDRIIAYYVKSFSLELNHDSHQRGGVI